MKKIFLFVLLYSVYFILHTGHVNALTPTPTSQPIATPTPKTPVGQQINQLKDRIASRVAELKLVERRGVIGKVTESSQTHITITDSKNNTRFVDVDELTKFASPSAGESFGISDIEKGANIGVLGLYNKQSRRILSRFISVVSLPSVIRGAVVEKDEENFVVSVISENGTTMLVDIENITKTTSYDKLGDATRAGFSKIKPGQRIMIVGFPSKKDEARMIASRVLLFPEFPKNPKITLDAPISTESSAVTPTP